MKSDKCTVTCMLNESWLGIEQKWRSEMRQSLDKFIETVENGLTELKEIRRKQSIAYDE